MRAIYVHFHMWERNNEWSYTIIYANREIYEFAWRREEVNSYTPWPSMHEIREVDELMSWRSSYNLPTLWTSSRQCPRSIFWQGEWRHIWEVVSTMSQRSYQKVTRTNLLLHPTHSTLLVSYKDDSSVAARILHCQRCLSYNLTTPSRANCGLNRARTAHATQSL